MQRRTMALQSTSGERYVQAPPENLLQAVEMLDDVPDEPS